MLGLCGGSISSAFQDESFEEDEGVYEELNLDEEEEKFGLVADDDESEDSDDASAGMHAHLSYPNASVD